MSRRSWLSFTVTALAVALAVISVQAGEHGKQKAQTEEVVVAELKSEAVHVGEPFADAEQVKIAELLADPDLYVGKAVRLEGNVASYCHHQRGWFALADADGAVVRLVTAPAFKVPGEIEEVPGIGVGVVEMVEVPEDQAKHYADDHGLGSQKPESISGPQKQIIVRATGAEFVLPPGAAAAAEAVEAEPCDEHGHEEEAHSEHDDSHD